MPMGDDWYIDRLKQTQYRVEDCLPQVREFMAAVRDAVRGVHFIYRNQHYAYVYFGGDPMALGYIGFYEDKYTVWSRNITNGKFAEHNVRDYHALRSANLKTAVQNFKRYVRRYSADELARLTCEAAKQAGRAALEGYYKTFTNHRSAWTSEVYSSGRLTPLQTELKLMLDRDHPFENKQLELELRAWFKAREALAAVRNHPRQIHFVQVHEDWRGQVLSHVPMNPVQGEDMTGFGVKSGATPTTVPVAEAPEFMVGRISVLAMTTERTYVEGVGVKIGESMYYVEE